MGIFDKITGKEAKAKAEAAAEELKAKEAEAAAKAKEAAAKAREEAFKKKNEAVKVAQQEKVALEKAAEEAKAAAEQKVAEAKKAANEKFKLAVDGDFGPKSIKTVQHLLGCTEDGICGTETIKASVAGPETFKAFQKWANKELGF